jgi:hypothetical protein
MSAAVPVAGFQYSLRTALRMSSVLMGTTSIGISYASLAAALLQRICGDPFKFSVGLI